MNKIEPKAPEADSSRASESSLANAYAGYAYQFERADATAPTPMHDSYLLLGMKQGLLGR